ncbi:hypothetical protein GCM10011521_09010 [Arenimonas soli]|uniref:Uncharacterized protein n=1 Tax=Arenimonas soli TaxID=2269504 RepID=A0ABQ1HDY6_9GAMM|nr:hypothetical protein GCM10011521_09010 [Arenimonas soli]
MGPGVKGKGLAEAEKQKSPALGWAFISGQANAPGYPAERWASGRRAREVMPAAIQAEVITAAVGAVQVMGREYAGGPGWPQLSGRSRSGPG